MGKTLGSAWGCFLGALLFSCTFSPPVPSQESEDSAEGRFLNLVQISPASSDNAACDSNENPIAGMMSGEFHNAVWFKQIGAKAWGSNVTGQLGLAHAGTPTDVPSEITDLGSEPVRGMTAGNWHTCAWFDKGAKCWGDSRDGQLGTGAAGGIFNLPQEVLGLGFQRILGMTAGADHTCAWLSGRGVSCWGGNRTKQLGIDGLHVEQTRWSPNDTGETQCVANTKTVLIADSNCKATHTVTCEKPMGYIRTKAYVSAYPEGSSRDPALKSLITSGSKQNDCYNTKLCRFNFSIQGVSLTTTESCAASTTGYAIAKDNRLYRIPLNSIPEPVSDP